MSKVVSVFKTGIKSSVIVLAALVVTLCACDQGSDAQVKSRQVLDQKSSLLSNQNILETAALADEVKSSFSPFFVYYDKASRKNHFIPSGFMPDGKCIHFNDAWEDNCYVGKSCIRIEYDIECSRKYEKWAGIYWLNPPNNWGKRKGGYNLTGATRLTFWAKGEHGGEQIQEFTIGGISGDYPDSDTIVIGPIILTEQWRQYSIDLRGKDLSYISGGFAWTTSEEVNSDSCVFFLDNIRYE